jgi:hypothetical protein
VKKKDINKVREVAFSMRVGDDGDDSPIIDMISIYDMLYCVTMHGVYELKTADSTDPERLNIDIPNTRQKVASVGAGSDVVCKTLLTAKKLFDKKFLGKDFDQDKAMSVAMNMLKYIVYLEDIKGKIQVSVENKKYAFIDNKCGLGSLFLPSIPSLKDAFDSFVSKANHVVGCFEALAKMFYGDKLSKKWIDSLVDCISELYGDCSELAGYIKEVRDFLLYINKVRNLTEHPKSDEFIDVDDFKLLPSGEIVIPVLTISLRDKDKEKSTVVGWMEKIIHDLICISEGLIVCLCGANVKPFCCFRTTVVLLSPEQRNRSNVCFSYAAEMGGRFVPYL